MQPVPAQRSSRKRETQPAIAVPAASKLLVLHGGEPCQSTVKYLDKLIASTTLKTTVLDIDRDCPGEKARDAISRLTGYGDAGSHFLINVHGSVSDRGAAYQRPGKHALFFSGDNRSGMSTEYVLNWIASDLTGSVLRRPMGVGSRPFVHIHSCHAGILRKHLRPGSSLWKSAYFMVYAGNHETSLSGCGNAITAAIRYIDLCDQQERAVDPLKLLYLAGLRRGGCMTLMGGDLTGPLVWHAPKSEADLDEQRSLAMLKGNPQDISALLKRIESLTKAELALLPAEPLRELLSNRLARDDAESVTALLAKHPELLGQTDAFGDLPVIEAVEMRAERCLAVLLKKGADPNQSDQQSSALTKCAQFIPSIEILRLLLTHGASPDLMDPEGFTALMCAVDQEWEDGIRLLLAHGARVDARDPNGWTCLEFAALHGKSRALPLLLAAGAGEAEGLKPELIRSVQSRGHAELALTMTEHLQRLKTAGAANV